MPKCVQSQFQILEPTAFTVNLNLISNLLEISVLQSCQMVLVFLENNLQCQHQLDHSHQHQISSEELMSGIPICLPIKGDSVEQDSFLYSRSTVEFTNESSKMINFWSTTITVRIYPTFMAFIIYTFGVQNIILQTQHFLR